MKEKKTTIYNLIDLLEFFRTDDNYAAIELFNSMSNEIEFVTKGALYNMFDEGYARIIEANVIGRINLV